MKFFVPLGLICLLAPAIFAEHSTGSVAAGGHSGGVGASHHGARPHASARTFDPGRYRGYGSNGFYGGYFDPFYDDSGYGPPPDQGPPSAAVGYPPPVVVMAPQTVHSVIHEYTQPEDYGAAPQTQTEPVLYLIAFRDNTIRAVSTYWVDGGTLHYLDRDHQEKQAPVSTIDRNLSAQLNRERHVPFNVP